MLHGFVLTDAVPGDEADVAGGIGLARVTGLGTTGTGVQLDASPKLAMLNLAVMLFAATKFPALSIELLCRTAVKVLLLV